MKKRFLLLIIPAVLITAAVLKTRNMQNTHPENGYLFTGTAEVTEVRLSFKTSGRIEKILFEEGDSVNQGDAVAFLDDTDEKLAVSAAQANLQLSRASLAEVLAGSRKQEIRNAKASLDMALAAVKKLAYPVRDGIPVMLESEARQLSADEKLASKSGSGA